MHAPLVEEDKANEVPKADPDASRRTPSPFGVLRDHYGPLKPGPHPSRAELSGQALTTGLTAEALDTKGG